MRTNYVLTTMIFGMLLLSSCSSDSPTPVKSSVLGVEFTSASSKNPGNARIASSGFTVNTFSVNIADVVIEENSGNDEEQQGNHQDGKDDKNEGKSSEEETEDILLSGPFLLDLSNGSAFLDEAAVYPGTFKKINFTFVPTNNQDFAENSIVLTGDYTLADGSVVSVSLRSGFDQQIQLPLANGGVTVADNSSVKISVVLDANTLISNVDLASAAIVDGTITIDKSHNVSQLKQFETALRQYIEVED